MQEQEKKMQGEIRRPDGPDKVTGDALFPADIHRPGLLVGRILHSTLPHARIRSLRAEKALALPGVAAVITGLDFPDRKRGMIIQDEPTMARDRIRYCGEPIAAVAAVDARTADRALELIEVELEALPAVLDFEGSVDPKAPLIHEDYETYTTARPIRRYGNICLHTRVTKGDIQKGFEESDRIFEDRYRVPVVYHAPLEPKAVVAERSRAGKLRLWCSTARPFAVQEGVAHGLGLPMSDVRVTAIGIGGHFGGKGEVTIEPVAAMLAMKAKGAVKLALTRRQEFLLDNPRHPMEIAIRTGVKKDGTLVAREATLKVETGAYSYFGPSTTSNASVFMTGPYRIPHLHIEGICAYTNSLSCGPNRGPGAPQAHFAVETHMDRIARELGLDPFELRLKNALREKDSTATGQVLDYVGYRETLLRLRSAAEPYLKNRGEFPGDRSVGVGIAGGFWGMGAMGSSATLKLNEDGTAVLTTGAVEIGAGSHTAMAILVSQGLGIPLDRIKVVGGDTDTCPYDFGAIGSRTTQTMGVAVDRAIQGVRDQLFGFAEDHLDAPREMLVLINGNIQVRGRPEPSIPVARAVRALTNVKGGPVIATGSNTASSPAYDSGRVESLVAPSRPFFCFGAQAAVVEVDKVTGRVSVLKVFASHNVGKAIFPQGVEGQIQGGVAMGLGYALSEEGIFSEGSPVNVSFLDYRVPTMQDVPEIVPIVVEREDAVVPDDIRGVGEPPTVPTAAAVANAIHDAVGVRLNQLPLTPERVFWEMMKGRREN